MKRFYIFVRKETIQILRDYRTMMIIILMPIIQIILFGFAISTEVNNVDVAIVTSRHSESVRKLAERLDANPFITLCQEMPADADAADRLMKKGTADIAVVIDKDFDKIMSGSIPSRPAIQLLTDASNPVMSRIAAGYVRAIVGSGTTSSELPVSVNTRMLYNPQMLSSYTFVPGILGLIFLIICTLITSISIVREKETGTMDLLLTSPIRPIVIIGAKLVPYFVLSGINLTTILLLAKFLLAVPMQGSIPAICAVSLLYILLSLALGILISTIADNQIMAILISAVVMLIPVIMLSGLIFPIENLPEILQCLSSIIPARWYVDTMRKLMIEGLPVSAVSTQISILSAMAAFLIFAAVKKFNKHP